MRHHRDCAVVMRSDTSASPRDRPAGRDDTRRHLQCDVASRRRMALTRRMSKPYKVRRPPPEDSKRFYLVTLVVILVAMVTGGILSRLLY